MHIKSAKFIKSIVSEDEILEDGKPQIALIGRSNVGKSSLINTVTRQKGLAKTSSFPGRTQQVNIFLINNNFYLVDLPGYGYAKASKENRDKLEDLINWYLFHPEYKQKKIVFIIDANVGMTDNDVKFLQCLEEEKKDFLIVANKIDKIKKSEYHKKLQAIQKLTGNHKVIPYSTQQKMTGVDLMAEFLK